MGAFGLSLAIGPERLSGEDLWQAALHQGDAVHQALLWDVRLPRTLVALMAGAGLGMSGALMQGMLRNGLADPFLLGISAGAALTAVALLTLGLFLSWVPLAAWLGAMVTTLIVYLLARTRAGLSSERLILAGVAVNSLLGSVTTTLLLLADQRVHAALNWLNGSLNGRTWADVTVAGPYLLGGLIAGTLLARPVNLLSLGDDLAVGLGVTLNRTRLLIGGVAALLAAGTATVAGLVGFVGLVVPHGVRMIVGTDYRWVLPLSAVAGGLLVILADTIARSSPIELPVGVITSLVGAPMFVWLLYRRSQGKETHR